MRAMWLSYGRSSAAPVVILGSATPALETFHNARSGKYLALSLPQRVRINRAQYYVIDQRATPRRMSGHFGAAYQAIAACLQRQEQCLIMIKSGALCFLPPVP